jgi:hypothetical protein
MNTLHAWAVGEQWRLRLFPRRAAVSALAPGRVQMQLELFVVVHASDSPR